MPEAPLPDAVSPTFCALPWIHLATRTGGTMQICCVSTHNIPTDDGVRPLRLGKDRYADAWNSRFIREVRERILRGEKIDACRHCHAEEALGGHSMRKGFNEAWLGAHGAEIMERVETSKTNGFQVEKPPLYLDLRQGNLCNLRCRSCSPENSAMVQREFQGLASKSDWFRLQVHSGEVAKEVADWYEQPSFQEELRGLLPHVRKLYFTGGEPTLIDDNYKLMQECVTNGYAADIELMFNINLMLVPDEFITLLPHFKRTLINLSVDGFGRVQEYLRPPSKWSTIERNLRKLLNANIANLHLTIDPVFQLTNALQITDLFRYVQALNVAYPRRLQILPIILDEPRHLDSQLLPEEARRTAIERLELYREDARASGHLDELFASRLHQLIARLQLPPLPQERLAALLDKFYRFTVALDAERGHSFVAVFPELSRIMQLEQAFSGVQCG
jgi:sulfatase maturation enzyme AslB (radical SAM superfamily)